MQILIQALFAGPAIPAGVTKASTSVAVTDSAGAVQTFSLTGAETPPYSVSVTVVAGDGSVTLTDIDTTGATIGAPSTVSYSGSGTGGALGVSGATITVTP